MLSKVRFLSRNPFFKKVILCLLFSMPLYSKTTEAEAEKPLTGFAEITGYGVQQKASGKVDLLGKESQLILSENRIDRLVLKFDLTKISGLSKNLEKWVKSEDVLDVARFPFLAIESKEILFLKQLNSKKKLYKVTATIKLKAQTIPIEFNMITTQALKKLSIQFNYSIADRTQWGFKLNSKKYLSEPELAENLVEDNIDLSVTIVRGSEIGGKF